VIMVQLRNRVRLPKEVARSNTGNSAHNVNQRPSHDRG
jgi:hypothetical protein